MDREHIKLAGVGRRLTHKLNALGIKTALDLCQSDVQDIRRRFSVVLARTVSELQGASCLELEQVSWAMRREFFHQHTQHGGRISRWSGNSLLFQ